MQSALKVLEAGADLLAATVNSAWSKLKNTQGEKPFIVLTGGLTRSKLYVKLIQERVSALLDCNYIDAEADHLVGAEKAAEIFPDGVENLLVGTKEFMGPELLLEYPSIRCLASLFNDTGNLLRSHDRIATNNLAGRRIKGVKGF